MRRNMEDTMIEFKIIERLKKFEHIIIYFLIVMMVFVVTLSTIRLGSNIFQEMMKPPKFLLNIDQLFVVFGFFLMILIGLELLESLRSYITADQIHVEVIFTIALIAVARKVITLNLTDISPGLLYGIAGLLLSLGIGYFLIKKAHGNGRRKKRE